MLQPASQPASQPIDVQRSPGAASSPPAPVPASTGSRQQRSRQRSASAGPRQPWSQPVVVLAAYSSSNSSSISSGGVTTGQPTGSPPQPATAEVGSGMRCCIDRREQQGKGGFEKPARIPQRPSQAKPN
ncbi:immediate early response gene 5 protein-like [Schistocerca gregaria]|uniref:immediate early response gene 5 protein-like n=1 Tax=Schistocerca gregaria TaxID=7010 RepID=UPI00211E7E12|nr:immediate early response gene 5 protein-like [Schistocerca gregaria]